MDMKNDARGGLITVEDLILEISYIHSCELMLSWDAVVGKTKAGIVVENSESMLECDENGNCDDFRRYLAYAMAEDGYSGMPSIKSRVTKMIEEDASSVHHARTKLPFLSSFEINDAPSEWIISADAANIIRGKLLTDNQRQIIALKKAEGRYTLEEAANWIAESIFYDFGGDGFDYFPEMEDTELDELALEDELDAPDDLDVLTEICSVENECDDIEYSKILQELSSAATSGELSMYVPGTDKRHIYTRMNGCIYKEVCVYYEEVLWRDLNAWLEKKYPNIEFRFEDPSEENSKDKGIIKAEIVGVDWPLPAGKNIKTFLEEGSDWIVSARVARGRPGGGINGSHRWNPAQLAICLNQRWASSATRNRLTKVLKEHYPEYLDQWNDYLET